MQKLRIIAKIDENSTHDKTKVILLTLKNFKYSFQHKCIRLKNIFNEKFEIF